MTPATLQCGAGSARGVAELTITSGRVVSDCTVQDSVAFACAGMEKSKAIATQSREERFLSILRLLNCTFIFQPE
jgi:hypothetical protein